MRKGSSGASDPWEALLQLLDRKALTMAEAEEALVERGFGRTKARTSVAKARRLGMLDDRRIADDIAEGGGWKAPQGVLRVRHELERRGVPERVADEALGSVDDLERCRAALAAYLERHGAPADLRAVARIVSHLARRGFTEDSVRQSLTDRGIEPGWHDA